ncbi:ArsR/SmtB family transcription factor [Euzebya tangerina]|uniref:ArsR/SmtB family transcription factor n=1 Tax=Euzebya tangerina TaxID=591198 RepID=UPI000E317787|nr:helix-turn-helix transcriptional regulator [Euzebya tangerina]
MSADRLAAVASLLADQSRAAILTALLGGTAHTGNELARHVGIAPSTASEHLGRLLDGGLVAVESQGRHRYWRLASPDVAELIESLVAHAPDRVDGPSLPRPSDLALGRSCYDHLAGRVAVDVYGALVERGHLLARPGAVEVTDSGRVFLGDLGLPQAAFEATTRPPVRACLDWTGRRHHLAGAVGAALLDTLLDRGWARRGPRPRQIRFTRTGRAELTTRLGIGW